jgi:3-dehydroquinate dehydratase/shikimate dehydrogenase
MTDLPLILTARRAQDEGRTAWSENERISVLRAALRGGFSWIDLEEDLETGAVDPAGASVIRSLHIFDGVPDDIPSILDRLSSRPGEIPKLAVYPRGTADLLRLIRDALEWKSGSGRRRDAGSGIVLGMGGYGIVTRILYRRLGSLFSYASDMEAGTSSSAVPGAPGQIPPRLLSGLYRADTIADTTAVFGIAGNPVAHSLSPLLHNRGYIADGLDAVYLPFLVDDWDAGLRLFDLLGVRGLSVTVPFKERAAASCVSLDPCAAAAAACNTMVREGGHWRGFNTDIPGFLGSLTPILRGLENRGRRIPGRALVIGAGGAAKGIVSGLVGAGWTVEIVNRTAEKARLLAETVGCGWREIGGNLEGGWDLVVQTTSAGMAPDLLTDPLPGYRFTGGEGVVDIVYSPPVTRFLSRAAESGCLTANGLPMLVSQGLIQYRLFTGKEYPFLPEDAVRHLREAAAHSTST